VEDKDLVWEEIETEHIVQDEWIDFRKSTYKYPDGRVFAPYYSYSRRDYTVIVASDEDGKYLCVRQFRQGIKEVTTEFPAGGIEKSDGKEYGSKDAAEAALDCAKRELREETGYESSDWTHLITVPSNATISDNYAYVFMARNCMKAGEQKLDDTEYLNVKKLSADEIEALIHAGKFQQSVHVMAWLLAKEKKQNLPGDAWNELSHEEKTRELYNRQKHTLDQFLERGAISKAQYEKSLHDLTEKMGM
jgi:ADP-ribose pyrophosphatase